MQINYFVVLGIDRVFTQGEFMPGIADKVIERIKTDISLLWLIKSQGYQPKKQGKDYVLSCPFHNDRTPSCVISPDKNLWHCLGVCNEGGSVID